MTCEALHLYPTYPKKGLSKRLDVRVANSAIYIYIVSNPNSQKAIFIDYQPFSGQIHSQS